MTIGFHLILSHHYLCEMLSKYWDLITILPMITNLFMTYDSTPFDPKVNVYGKTHDILTNGLSTTPHTSSHHLHIKLHISTYYYDTPAVDSGVKQAQVFVGKDTLVSDAYPLKGGNQFYGHP